MSLAKETKRCPFCKEVINATAVRCKHCHADLSDGTGKKPGRVNALNTFRNGFLTGVVFSAIIALLIYLQCSGQ